MSVKGCALTVCFVASLQPMAAAGMSPEEYLDKCRIAFDFAASSSTDLIQGGMVSGYNLAVLDHAVNSSRICIPKGSFFNLCQIFKEYMLQEGAPGDNVFPHLEALLYKSFPCDPETQ